MNGTYTDSRGAEMPATSWSDALETVLDLARSNVLQDHQTLGDPNLKDHAAWQQSAVDTLESVLEACSIRIDGLPASSAAGDWPSEATKARLGDDPARADLALRICLDLAEQAALDPSDISRDVELADECDRQQQALDMTRDFLGMHSGAFAGLSPETSGAPKP